MVEGARLESVFRGNSNVGSNPTLSATLESITYKKNRFLSGNVGKCMLGLVLKWHCIWAAGIDKIARQDIKKTRSRESGRSA